MKNPAELTHGDLEEINETLKRVEQKLDLIITRLLPDDRTVHQEKLMRLHDTKDWSESAAWKRTHAI